MQLASRPSSCMPPAVVPPREWPASLDGVLDRSTDPVAARLRRLALRPPLRRRGGSSQSQRPVAPRYRATPPRPRCDPGAARARPLCGPRRPRLSATFPRVAFDAVGFSLGAKILLDLALRSPRRIERLVLGGVGDNVFAPEAVAESVALVLERGPDEPIRRQPCGPSCGPGSQTETMPWQWRRCCGASPTRFSPRSASGELAHPVLIVNGADDPVSTLGVRLVSTLPHVDYVELPGVDHFGLPGQPAFIRRALEFLAGGQSVDAPAAALDRAT